jgi:hypothetical protein
MPDAEGDTRDQAVVTAKRTARTLLTVGGIPEFDTFKAAGNQRAAIAAERHGHDGVDGVRGIHHQSVLGAGRVDVPEPRAAFVRAAQAMAVGAESQREERVLFDRVVAGVDRNGLTYRFSGCDFPQLHGAATALPSGNDPPVRAGSKIVVTVRN